MSYVLEIRGSQEIQGRRSGYSCSYWLSFSRSGHTWCENSEYRVLLWCFVRQNCNCKQFLLYSLRGKRFGFGRAKNRSSFFNPETAWKRLPRRLLAVLWIVVSTTTTKQVLHVRVQCNYKPWISILCTHVAFPSVNQRFVVEMWKCSPC